MNLCKCECIIDEGNITNRKCHLVSYFSWIQSFRSSQLALLGNPTESKTGAAASSTQTPRERKPVYLIIVVNEILYGQAIEIVLGLPASILED